MKFPVSILFPLLLLVSCKQEVLTLYIGTYTSKGSAGIYICDFYGKNKSWSIRDSIPASNPSYLALSKDRSLLYAVNENSDSLAALQCFALSGSSPVLKANLPTRGADPCYVTANSELAFTANYSGGSLSVFSLCDGVPSELVQLFKGSAGGPDSLRQSEPHIHCAIFSPDGDYLLTSDFSSDKILIYRVFPDSLSYHSSCALPSGSGVRHLCFHPEGQFLYSIGELDGRVCVFSYSDGEISMCGSYEADPLKSGGSADIRVSPDGKYLYASHRLESDGISIFRILDGGARLESLAYEKTGGHPRNFRISPDGKYLFCACRDSDRIDIYEIQDGRLYPSDIPSIPISQPVCIEF
ncbi:MAG: lactonase family protein [Candidatus Cryptobacteroides sp.]